MPLIRQLINSEQGHMLLCRVREGSVPHATYTRPVLFQVPPPPTARPFVLQDQPSPHCEWAQLIKPHRIIVSKSHRIISHPFEKHNARFSFSPLSLSSSSFHGARFVPARLSSLSPCVRRGRGRRRWRRSGRERKERKRIRLLSVLCWGAGRG